MADKTYNINFKANVQGLDNVIKQFETILNMNGVNLTGPMQKQWQRLKTLATGYIEEMNKELSKPQPDMAILDTLDKKLSKITTKANNFSNTLAGLMLPKELSEKLSSLQKKIEKLNQDTINLNRQRFGNQRKLNSSNESGLAKTEEEDIFSKINGGTITIKDQVVSSWEDFKKVVDELRQSGKLTGEQLQQVNEIINNTTNAFAKRKQELEKSIETDKKQIDNNKKNVEKLQQQISNIRATDVAQEQLTAEQQKYLNIIKELNTLLTQLGAQQIKTNEQTQKNISNKQTETTVITNNTKAQEKNTSTLVKATKNLITYGTVYSILRRILNTTITTIKDMDEALTGMAVVTNMSREQTWELAGTLQQLGRETGLAATEIANAATMFYQQGKSTTQVLELTEAAAKAAAIAGIDLTTSVDLLTNAMNGFQMASSQAMEVSDKFAALAAAAATDYEELAVALSKVAAQANLAGMSMDFTLGMLTAGIEVTREAPETIGTALKTIIARMRELTDYGKTLEDGADINRVATALDEIGVALTDETGMMRDLENVITEVGQKWNTLNKNQQANVAVAMAGTRQQSRFIAMMQDFERTQELVNLSMNSYGATLAQHSKYMDGLTAATNNLTTAWQTMITNFTGSEPFINFVNMLTRLVDTVDVWLNDMGNIYVILGAIATIGIGILTRKIQEYMISQQIANIEAQQRIAKNNADIESIKNAARERAMEQASLKDQKLKTARIKTQAALQRKTFNEELIASKKQLRAEKQITAEIQKQNGQTEDAAKTKVEIEGLNKEIEQYEKLQIKYNKEYNKAIQQQHQLEAQYTSSIKLTQEENLAIQQKQIQNQQEYSSLLGGLGPIINGLIAPISMISSVVQLIHTQYQSINAAKTQGIKLTNRQKIAEKSLENQTKKVTLAKIAQNVAQWIPIAGAVIAAVITGYTFISTMIANAQSQSKSELEKVTEQLEDLQVKLYETNSIINNIESLADEFDDLSSKIGKSNDELERLKEIAQEVNDIAGYTVVDINDTYERQLASMQAYINVLETELQNDTEEIEKRLESLTKAKVHETIQDMNDWNPVSRIKHIVRDQTREERNQLIDTMLKIDPVFAESVRSIAKERITGLDNIKNTEVRDAILSVAVNNFKDIVDDVGNIDFTEFNKIINEEFISGLDEIYTSGDLSDYSTFFSQLTKIQKDYLQGVLPIFQIFNTINNETAQAFDNFGFNIENVNSVFANLLDSGEYAAKTFAKIVNEVNNMEFTDINGKLLKGEDELAAKRRKTFELLAQANKEFALEANEVVMMGDTERQQAIMDGNKIAADYQLALDKRNTAEEIALDKKVAYEKNRTDENKQAWLNAETNLELAEQEVAIYENAPENVIGQNQALANSLLDVETSSNLVDNLTRLSSVMERLSKINNISELSFEEQQEILKDYPELLSSMQNGYLQLSDIITILDKELDESKQKYKNSIESIKSELNTLYDYEDIQIDGISLSHLFDDNEIGQQLREQISSMSQQEILNLVEAYTNLTGTDAEKLANALQGSVIEFDQQSYFYKQIEKGSYAALLAATDMNEAFNELTNSYANINNEIEQTDDLLDQLNDDSDFYNKTLQKRNSLLLKSNKEAIDNINKLQEELDKRMNIELKDKDGNVVSFDAIFTLSGGFDEEQFNKLDIDSQALVKLNSSYLEDLREQYQDYFDNISSNWESFFESYINNETAQTEELIEQLEARKEVYENYFDELDAMQEEEEYEQSRDSIIQQLQALSGGQDAASKQKIKELQAELNTLNEEQLDSQTQAQRDAILAELDSEIEIQNDLLDSIDTYLGQLIEIIANPDRTEDQTDWIYDVIKTLVPNITDNEIHNLLGFSEGGYVNYTGLAMVHGSPSSPEAFLSAQDTTNIRALLDALAMGQTVDTSSFNGIDNASNIIQIDEINIQTNELNTEQDFSNAGRALADEFAQAIQKRGINLNVKR